MEHIGGPIHIVNTMSKAEQRKSNKPIMEKRRRARINNCLNDLKGLVLEAMKKDPARHSKLEKADILELAVKHLQTIQRQQLAVAVATDPSVLQKFKAGFSECASEVGRYVTRIDGVEQGVKQRLVSHLASCVTGLQQLTPLTFSAMAAPGMAGLPLRLPTVVPHVPFPAGDVNNNHSRLMSGLQLVPRRLPSGELAFLLPASSSVFPFFPPVAASAPSSTVTSGAMNDDRSGSGSAFSSVRPGTPPSTGQSPTSPTSSSSTGSLTSPSTPKNPTDFTFKLPRQSPRFPDGRSILTDRSETATPSAFHDPKVHRRDGSGFPFLGSDSTSTSSRDPLDYSMKPSSTQNSKRSLDLSGQQEEPQKRFRPSTETQTHFSLTISGIRESQSEFLTSHLRPDTEEDRQRGPEDLSKEYHDDIDDDDDIYDDDEEEHDDTKDMWRPW